MGLFNKKPKSMSEKKRQHLIEKIKKNKTAINKLEAEAQIAPLKKGKTKRYIKLKEENVKMAKLVLKDGKLQKAEEVGQQQAPQVPQPPMAPQQQPSNQGMPQAPLPPNFPQQQTEANNMVGEPQLNAQIRQAPPQQAPQPDEYVRMMQQQEAQQRAQQEAILRQRQEAMARAQQEAMARAQAAAQQAPQPIPVPQPRGKPQGSMDITPVSLFLIGDKKISGDIPAAEVMSFIEDVKVAINTKSTFQFGDRFINGEHIVFYEIGEE